MASLLVRKPDGQEVRLPLGDETVIGKRPGNDLVVSEKLVSREHCRILRRNGEYVIEDLDSRNGTWVNGARISGPVPLRDRTPIRVGSWELIFQQDQAEAETSTPETPAPAVSAAPAEPAATEEEAVASTPVELKQRIHNQLLQELDLRHEDFYDQPEEKIRQRTEQAITKIIERMRDELPGWLAPQDLVKEIADEAIGLGPLEELLADPDVDEIMVNSWDRVYIEKHGRIIKTRKRFTNNQQVLNIIRRIIAPIGRRIDESSPMVDARLPDGSRVNAIIAPLALTGPTLTIRKFSTEPFKINDLIGFRSLTKQMSDMLKLAVHNRQNILISGGTGSGKTTLLNVVSNFIPRVERIITIEDAAELKLGQEHVISLEAKPPNIQGEGAIPIRQLVRNSLRMRPDRIIVGECRGGEALDMLQAMNTGHDGSLTTLHANSCRDALSRLETLVLMAGMELPAKAIREQVAAAINMIVQTARLSDGSRKITRVSEITGMEGDVITMQDIFEFQQSGYDKDGHVLGDFVALGNVPVFVHDLRKRGIDVDMSLFKTERSLSHNSK